MNESRFEDISALVDGESAGDEALAELLRSDEARRYWGRCHLIADCIRRQLPRRFDPALADRIAAALRAEATVLAPGRAPLRPWLRPLAGLAVAASVAALAIFTVHVQRGANPAAVPQQAVAAVSQPAAQGQVRLAAGSAAGGPARAQTAPGRMSARLNRYLVNYNEYRNNAAVQGMIPYVRIVTHDEDKK
jgi:sigma-E factor negative regulatory protein RseA